MLLNHHLSHEGERQRALHDQEVARSFVTSDARPTSAWDPPWFGAKHWAYWGCTSTSPGSVLYRIQAACQRKSLTPELLFQAEALDQYVASFAAGYTTGPRRPRCHSKNHAVPGFVYWPNDRVSRQGNEPPDERQPQLYVPEGPPS